MQRVAIDDVESRIQPAAVMRRLTDELELTDLAINYYELEPGDSFAYAEHSHEIQEEVFYIQSGTATFETEEGSITVDQGEVIRFAPGERQRGWNYGDTRVVALALGAPLEYGEQEILRDCPDCGERTDNSLGRAAEEEAIIATCEICGTETGRWYEGSMDGEVP